MKLVFRNTKRELIALFVGVTPILLTTLSVAFAHLRQIDIGHIGHLPFTLGITCIITYFLAKSGVMIGEKKLKTNPNQELQPTVKTPDESGKV